ncbi:DNA polymerase/3'-5' exonuclease PolX [Lacihabitans sp. CCS-44]|uniref:DNA polymerase/3'-5' exonuclease PolX n=1 Tax=Lacihabitans sp. CCS-44 TaxID=2487331 RepID=UPI0020CDCEA9|nr:DNA polymerase/3'-5' exonuclease PolX [Lacihabitans sp. CCS-44]MCP9755864.1 DNA polymerase/3'-5' exonuclease PolX [Lacihabitans sp. CCS-44]
MSNSDIADIIQLTGKLLDLHDRDEMRSKVYISSVFTLERLDTPIAEMSPKEVGLIRGFGKVLSANIEEIVKTGTLKELNDLIEITPEGIFDIFKVKGLGVKKIKTLWKELGIDNINDLKIACENHKIANAKGFGQKTQDAILESLAFMQEQMGKLRMNKAAELSIDILQKIKTSYENAHEIGQVVRKSETVDLLQFLVVKDGFGGLKFDAGLFHQDMKTSSPSVWRGLYGDFAVAIEIEKVSSRDFVVKNLIKNSDEEHLKYQNNEGVTFLNHLTKNTFSDESEAYSSFGFSYIIPEMREGREEFEWIQTHKNEDLVTWEKLKGTVHNHSTYSDGSHTLKEMADYCKGLGLKYFGIADHSQTASYASGLWPETVAKQHQEIDSLNAVYTDFAILKGIESDILINGDLDYEKDVLASFDYVVASVHAVLNMDKEKATRRLLKAVENPYTSILGHPSGRLLLSRKGYPFDYKMIIDACAANKVVMELNASPYRLDIDWRWIDYCLSKGVMISINPDAHETKGIHDMHYGVAVARKAGLTTDMTLNCLSKEEIMKVFSKK